MSEVALPERLKEARFATATRRRSQVSQTLMAALVGEVIGRELHQTQWSLYELGRSEPPLDIIAAAARLSGLTPEYIAFGVGPTNALVNRDTNGQRGEPSHPDVRAAPQTSGPPAPAPPSERPYPTPRFPMKKVGESTPKRRRRRKR